MSLLARYKKPGGFLQLVKLLEGFGKEKKEKFLTILEQEHPSWAGAVEQKMLTVERILQWEAHSHQDIFQRLHAKNIAAILHGLPDPMKDVVMDALKDDAKKEVLEQFERTEPTVGEIAGSMVMLIEETRELTAKMYLKLEDLDPELAIPDGIEEQLSSGELTIRRPRKQEAAPAVAVKDQRSATKNSEDAAIQFATKEEGGSIDAHELELMKRKIINLTKEVSLLKKENQELSGKLEQIRKIA